MKFCDINPFANQKERVCVCVEDRKRVDSLSCHRFGSPTKNRFDDDTHATRHTPTHGLEQEMRDEKKTAANPTIDCVVRVIFK